MKGVDYRRAKVAGGHAVAVENHVDHTVFGPLPAELLREWPKVGFDVCDWHGLL